MNLGENIYRLRTQKNLSQGDLADALEVSRQSVSKWENNAAVPELEKLKKMSQLFGVTLDELVSGEAPPPPEPVIQHIPERRVMPGHRIAGIILLCCGFLIFVAFTILGYLSGDVMLGLLAAIPFVLTGTVCILCKKHTFFACCWALYFPLWLITTVFLIRSYPGMNMGTIVSLAADLMLLALTVWTFRKIFTGQFSMTRAGKIIWSVILVVFFLFQISLLLPLRRVDVYEDEFEEVYTEITVAAE